MLFATPVHLLSIKTEVSRLIDFYVSLPPLASPLSPHPHPPRTTTHIGYQGENG